MRMTSRLFCIGLGLSVWHASLPPSNIGSGFGEMLMQLRYKGDLAPGHLNDQLKAR
jgi:hypothetical protein